MANITEAGSAFAQVYKLEKTDRVLGGDGTGDIANKQAHALMQSDNYLLSLLQNNDQDIILAILGGNYTPGDLIILRGCAITANIPGTSTITAGAIFYGTTLANAKVYRVPAATIASPAGTLVFKIDTTVDPNVIYLTNAGGGTGIADYDSGTVKSFYNSGSAGAVFSSVGVSAGWTIAFNAIQAIKRAGVVKICGTIQATSTGTNSSVTFTVNLTNDFKVRGSVVVGVSGLNLPYAKSTISATQCGSVSSNNLVIAFDNSVLSTPITAGQIIVVDFTMECESK